jgi:antitoxin (DNA-binding transcriptional repressor) of toxin-antitoxin stability system
MRTVGLKVLKDKLSEYVRLAESGEVVLVTDRDRVVAELRPPHERAPLASDALLADLVRKGVLSPPLMVREGPPPRLPSAPTAQLLSELEEDRADR